MRTLIAGASGVIGRALIRHLRANQHELFALSQSRDSARVLKEIGAEPLIADALDAAAVKTAVGRIRPDAVINELTSLPRHYTPAEMKAAAERDRKVRVEGNINLLAALRDAGARRYLLQSSGFWYAPGAGLADEAVPFISSASPGVEASARTYMELETRASVTPGIEFVALRYGFFTAPVPGRRAMAILVIRYGSSRFRLLVRATASTASCISTMRLGRPLPRWSARRERTT
jgi:2-alkyl-3-oxoalkanoate reductase